MSLVLEEMKTGWILDSFFAKSEKECSSVAMKAMVRLDVCKFISDGAEVLATNLILVSDKVIYFHD